MGRRAAQSLLERVGADLTAKYVAFRCDDPINYSSSIDMASALHPQTILCLTYADRPIEPKFGASMRLKMTTKLGFKQPKFITSVQATQRLSGRLLEGLRLQLVRGDLEREATMHRSGSA